MNCKTCGAPASLLLLSCNHCGTLIEEDETLRQLRANANSVLRDIRSNTQTILGLPKQTPGLSFYQATYFYVGILTLGIGRLLLPTPRRVDDDAFDRATHELGVALDRASDMARGDSVFLSHVAEAKFALSQATQERTRLRGTRTTVWLGLGGLLVVYALYLYLRPPSPEKIAAEQATAAASASAAASSAAAAASAAINPYSLPPSEAPPAKWKPTTDQLWGTWKVVSAAPKGYEEFDVKHAKDATDCRVKFWKEEKPGAPQIGRIKGIGANCGECLASLDHDDKGQPFVFTDFAANEVTLMFGHDGFLSPGVSKVRMSLGAHGALVAVGYAVKSCTLKKVE
jgi:hypothetical protein